MAEPRPIYVDGKVHVKARMCKTCIFRPGNKMHLREGRVEEMVATATADNSTIVCHDTLDGPQRAACRGFYDLHMTPTLALARHVGAVQEV